MLKQLGGTRAILAYLLTGAVIGGCFYTGMSDIKFTALVTLATTALSFYFANRSTLDKQ